MGKLGNQAIRKDMNVNIHELSGYIDDIKSIAKDKKLEVELVLKAAHVLELKRRNNLYNQNGDYFDEQIAGIGQILQSIADNLEDS